MEATTSASSSARRAVITVVAPAAATRCASPRPIPLEAPVMNTTRPFTRAAKDGVSGRGMGAGLVSTLIE